MGCVLLIGTLIFKGKKIRVPGISANFRDAIGRQSIAVHAPCLNHLAVSRMVVETRDPWNSNFFRPLGDTFKSGGILVKFK